MLAAAATGELGALVVGGVELADLPTPHAVRAALEAVGFVVSLENRALARSPSGRTWSSRSRWSTEKAGTFLNWEGRAGRFDTVIRQANAPMTDLRVLAALADALGAPLGIRTAQQALAETRPSSAPGTARPRRRSGPQGPAKKAAQPAGSPTARSVLATWRQLLDAGAAAGRRASTWRQPPATPSPGCRRRPAAAARRRRRRRWSPSTGTPAGTPCRW